MIHGFYSEMWIKEKETLRGEIHHHVLLKSKNNSFPLVLLSSQLHCSFIITKRHSSWNPFKWQHLTVQPGCIIIPVGVTHLPPTEERIFEPLSTVATHHMGHFFWHFNPYCTVSFSMLLCFNLLSTGGASPQTLLHSQEKLIDFLSVRYPPTTLGD